jgi:hypothetical protein
MSKKRHRVTLETVGETSQERKVGVDVCDPPKSVSSVFTDFISSRQTPHPSILIMCWRIPRVIHPG